MSLLYYAVVSTHVLAALFWLGGIFFLGVIGAPVLRAVEPPAVRQRIFQQLGLRFRAAGWVAVSILVASGLAMLQLRGLLRWEGVLGAADFWRSPFGRSLAVKLAAVVTMVCVSALHDFVLGPAAGRAETGSPRALRLRRRAALLARGNALVGLVIVLAAVRLARGG